MGEGEQQRQSGTLWDVFERYAKYIGVLGTIISVVTFSQGSRLASYVLLVVGYVLIAEFLWRVITQKSPLQRAAGIILPSSVSRRAEPRHRYPETQRRLALVGLVCLTLATFGWGGFNVWPDIQCGCAVVASRSQLRLIDINVWQAIQRWCPLPIKPAQDDKEILIVVSPFEKHGTAEPPFEYAAGIAEDLRLAGFQVRRLPPDRLIGEGEDTQARALGAITNATLVIWGWFDGGRVSPHYTVIPRQVKRVELDRFLCELDGFDFWADTELPQGMVYLTEFTLGQVNYLAEQYDEALDHFSKAWEALESVKEELSTLPQEKAYSYSWGEEYFYFYLAVMKANLESWSGAISYYQQAIERDDQFAEAYNNLGVAFSGQGNYNRAVENFDLAIRWGRDVAYYNRGHAYYNRGNAYYNWGRRMCDDEQYDEALAKFHSAIDDYTQAIDRLNSDYLYAAYFNRGLAHAASQNHNAAIEDYTQAIERAPDENPDPYLARARSRFELGQYEDALKDFSKLIEELATSQNARVQAFTARGVTYTRLGQYSEALDDCREALRLHPDYAPALYNLAATRSLEGDVERAIEALTRSIELNPDLATIAACDSDFDGIKDHQDLQELFAPPEGCQPDPCR